MQYKMVKNDNIPLKNVIYYYGYKIDCLRTG